MAARRERPGSPAPAAKAPAAKAKAPAAKAKAPARARTKQRAESRLTAREMVEQAFKLVGGAHQPRSTVKLEEGARGQVIISVLAQAGDPPEILQVASALAQAEFDRLRLKYHGNLSQLGDIVAGNGED